MADDVINAARGGADMEHALPSREELLDAVQKMDMDEESKRKLIENIMSGMPEYSPIDEEQAVVTTSNASFEILMLLALISLVFTILGEIFKFLLQFFKSANFVNPVSRY